MFLQKQVNKMKSFEDSVKILRQTLESKAQLDILRNGQVLLQVFKATDVKAWETKVDCEQDDELFIALFFHAAKLSNSENFDRFLKSELIELFQKVNLGIDTFLLSTKIYFTNGEVLNVITKVLQSVYQLSPGEQLEFRVNSY